MGGKRKGDIRGRKRGSRGLGFLRERERGRNGKEGSGKDIDARLN